MTAEAPGDGLQSHFHSVFEFKKKKATLKMKNSAFGSLN